MSRRKPAPVDLDPTAIPLKLLPSHVVAVAAAAKRAGVLRSQWMRDRLAEAVGVEPMRLRQIVAARALLDAVRGRAPEGRAPTVTARMESAADAVAVADAAEACGMKRSEWCRAVLLAAAEPEEHSRALALVAASRQLVLAQRAQ